MKGKTIDAARLLAFMQQHLTRESVLLYPNPAVLFSVEAKSFWDFVLSETETTPADLDAFLNDTFPDDDVPVDKQASEYLLHNYATEELEDMRAKLSNAREALAEIAGLETYVDGAAHASRIAAKGLEASSDDSDPPSS